MKSIKQTDPHVSKQCNLITSISDEHDGILELPTDAPIGQDIREYLQLDDKMIEVDLTPNRADCLGIRGLAREVGVLNQAEVCKPEIGVIEPTQQDTRDIRLQAPEACPRYLGRVMSELLREGVVFFMYDFPTITTRY